MPVLLLPIVSPLLLQILAVLRNAGLLLLPLWSEHQVSVRWRAEAVLGVAAASAHFCCGVWTRGGMSVMKRNGCCSRIHFASCSTRAVDTSAVTTEALWPAWIAFAATTARRHLRGFALSCRCCGVLLLRSYCCL